MRVVLVLLLFGCDSSTMKMMVPPDLAADAALAPALLGPLMPQVVQLNATRSVLAHPKVVAVSWDNDPRRADLEAFLADYAQSSAWADQTAEYGIGPLTVAAPKHFTGNAPATLTDGDLSAMITAEADTIFVFSVPNATKYDDGTGAKCCDTFDGYHSDVVVGGVDVPYAVLCQCPGFDGQNIDDVQQLTAVASHEVVEASADPFSDNPGFAQTDDDHAVWTYVSDGEIGDLCQAVDTSFWQPPDMTHTVQRIWSNRAAAAGHDPCVGQPTTPYYQTVPEANDTVIINDGSPWSTKGVTIAVGESRDVMLRVYGDGGPFTITVDDYSSVWLGGAKLLEITTPPQMFNGGDTLTATIKVLAKDAKIGSAEAFVVNTKPASGPTTYFYGVVGQ